MAGFKSFEEIIAWQKARVATRRVSEVTSKGSLARDFGLRDQIRRSAVSIMANIAEGQGRHSNKEFANFLNIAHGSVAETQSHLYIALDLQYVSADDFRELFDLLGEVARITMSSMKHLRA